jgi:hypothetical protein
MAAMKIAHNRIRREIYVTASLTQPATTTADSATKPSPLPWWLIFIVIIGATLMAAGGIIALVNPAMLVSPGAEINGAARVYAGYLVSRNLVLALMLLFMLAIRARNALGHLMLLTAFIQFLDAGLDIFEGRLALVPGVLVYAIAFFIGAAKLSGHAFWSAAAWREN